MALGIVAFDTKRGYILDNKFNLEEDIMAGSLESPRKTEAEVLDSFGLRWAVLAAWHDDLRSRGVAFDADVARRLETSRVKIASGVVSSCEVGCDLARVEAVLVSRTATVAPERVDEWISTLSLAMTAPEDVKARPWFRSVSVSYLDCGYRRCFCPV